MIVENLIKAAVENLNSELAHEDHLVFSGDQVLFGPASTVDSLSLVALIMDVEMALADNDIYVSLTDDENMAIMEAPFETVGSFTEYVKKLINRNG
jgi:acyl carrier protein